MTDTIHEIGARQAAKRYAEMVATSAAAEERIAELQKAVEEAEYFRSLAEMQLSAATWPEGVGQILHAGTDEPDDEVVALLDIYGGQVYRRAERASNTWVRAEVSESGATHYTWPIDEAGPFLKLHDDWDIRRIVDSVKAAAERDAKLRNRFRHESGYYPEGQTQYSFAQVDVADGVISAYADLQIRWSEGEAEIRRLRAELDTANRELDIRRSLTEPTA